MTYNQIGECRNTGRTHFKKGQSPWNKNKKFSYKPNPKLKDLWKAGKYDNRKINYKLNAKKISATQQGIKIGEWREFKSSVIDKLRKSTKYRTWRTSIFLRDKFTCQNSNCKFCNNKVGVFLHAHHIKPKSKFPELIFHLDNGITYCAKYHLKLHSDLCLIKSTGGL